MQFNENGQGIPRRRNVGGKDGRFGKTQEYSSNKNNLNSFAVTNNWSRNTQHDHVIHC